MPDIDRDALNRALTGKLFEHGHAFMIPLQAIEPGRSATVDFCGSLDAAVAALIALGLQWQKTGVKTVAVWRYGEHAEIQPADDATPAALATAFVQAALKVLGKEESDA